MRKAYLFVGGLVAAGFDATGSYLLTVTHSGRGIFSTATWTKVARDYTTIYPESGLILGIGPIDGQNIPVTQMNFETGTMCLTSPDGSFTLKCESSGIAVEIPDLKAENGSG